MASAAMQQALILLPATAFHQHFRVRWAAREQRRQVRVSNVNSDPQPRAGAPRKGLRRRRCRNAGNVVFKNSLYARKTSRVPAYLYNGDRQARACLVPRGSCGSRPSGWDEAESACPPRDRPGRAPEADWPSLLSDQEPLCRGGGAPRASPLRLGSPRTMNSGRVEGRITAGEKTRFPTCLPLRRQCREQGEKQDAVLVPRLHHGQGLGADATRGRRL